MRRPLCLVLAAALIAAQPARCSDWVEEDSVQTISPAADVDGTGPTVTDRVPPAPPQTILERNRQILGLPPLPSEPPSGQDLIDTAPDAGNDPAQPATDNPEPFSPGSWMVNRVADLIGGAGSAAVKTSNGVASSSAAFGAKVKEGMSSSQGQAVVGAAVLGGAVFGLGTALWAMTRRKTSTGTNPCWVWVDAHFRSAGTYVPGHYRTCADQSLLNNFSTRGNLNPFTGQAGYVNP